MNPDVGQTKTLYWKAKNNSGDPQDLSFDDASTPKLSGYEVKWFRGDHNISSQVEGSGYEFSLGDGNTKIFRARLERVSSGMGFCLGGQAGTPDIPWFDGAYFGVNGDCT